MSDILDNYIKLFLLLRGPATQALRALMTYYLRKCCLTFKEFIDTNQHEIYHLHTNRRCCQCSDQFMLRDTQSKLWTEEIIDRLEKKLNIENLLNEIKTDVEKIIGNEKDSQKILQKKMVQIYVALKKLISKPTKNNPAQAFTSLSHKNYTELCKQNKTT
ncbi:hypothetical protein AM593_08987, partial [Mytilus galloprovincialis]